MRRALLLCLVSGFLITPGWARQVYQEELSEPFRVRYSIWGQTVLELVTPDPSEVERVAGLLRNSNGPVRVQGASLYLGGELLLSVNPEQAARWATTPQSLARIFAGRLGKAFDGPPPLSAEPSSLVVPLGEKRRTRLSSVGEVSAPSFVAVEQQGDELLIEGLAPGSGEILVETQLGTLTIPLKVRPWAAILPQRLEVELTGGQAFQEALERALLPYLHADATVTFEGDPEKGWLQVSAHGSGLLERSGIFPSS